MVHTAHQGFKGEGLRLELEFRVWGLGLRGETMYGVRVWNSGCMVHGNEHKESPNKGFRGPRFGFRVSGSGLRVSSFGFGVLDSGFRVSGSRFLVWGFG